MYVALARVPETSIIAATEFCEITLRRRRASKTCLREVLMTEPLLSGKKVLVTGAIALGFLGYVFLAALPDLRCYIRISTM